MKWNSEAEKEFWRHKCRDSFYWFFRVGWGYDFNPLGGAGPRKWFRDETHKEACDWIERHLREWLNWRAQGINRTKKLAFVVAREWGKSTLLTNAVPAWLLLQDPELAITIDSESEDKAKMLLSPVAAVMSGEDKYSNFARLYGTMYSSSRSWSRAGLVIALRRNLARKEPSVGTCSVERGITMQHPDVWLNDDPTSYEKLRGVANWKEVVNEHTDAMDPVFGQGTLWLWPGTRYGDDDHYGTTLKAEGVASVTGGELPDLDCTPDGEWHVFYLPGITPDGKLTMPHIWSRKRIENWERRNPVRCAAQVKLDPFEASINPLTRAQAEASYIPDTDDIPWKMFDYTFHFDLAFKRPDRLGKGDSTGFVSWGHRRDGSAEIVLDGAWYSNAWQADDLAARVIMEYQRIRKLGLYVRVMTCEQEAGGATGMWEAHLQNKFAEAGLVMPRFEYMRRMGRAADKTERLISAAAFWRDGKVKVPRGRAGASELVNQMCRIMGSKRKDVADAAADVFNPVVYRAMRATVRGDDKLVIPPNMHDELLKGNLDATEIHATRIAEFEASSAWQYDPI